MKYEKREYDEMTFTPLYTKSTTGIVRKLTYNFYSSKNYGEISTVIETKNGSNIKSKKQEYRYRISKESLIKSIKAKIKRKLRSGYKTLEMLGYDEYKSFDFDEIAYLLEDNKTDATGNLKPMKAIPFKFKILDEIGTMIGQPKINGLRGTLKWQTIIKNEGIFSVNEERAVIASKEGLFYHLPHITDSLTKDLFIIDGDLVQYDGELYIPNEQLNVIRASCPMIDYANNKISKCSRDPLKVSLWVFDISIDGIEQDDRLELLYEGLSDYPIAGLNLHDNTSPIMVLSTFDLTVDNYLKYLDDSIEVGYEGIIFRNSNTLYQFGHRNKAMMKLKKHKNTECKILDIILKGRETDNGKIRTFIALVLENDLNKETFECTPEGNEEYRCELLDNKDDYVGKLATVRFFERSGVKKVPFHANVETIGREDIGDININDLNIEL